MIKINEISLEDCVRLHKEMWMYIAEHLNEELGGTNSYEAQINARANLKVRYCRKLVEDKIIDNYPQEFCFICQYATNHDEWDRCEQCPAIWGTEDIITIDNVYCEYELDNQSKDVLNWVLSNPKDIANIEFKENL